MDRDFIARNQIVERYLSGKLPIKGATEFEKFCADNPGLLDEIGLPERVNAGLRLLEAAGKPEPWQEPRKRFWEKPWLALGLGVAAIALGSALALVWQDSTEKSALIAKLERQVIEKPMNPGASTRKFRVLPDFKRDSDTPSITLGGPGPTQLADISFDMSKSGYRSFRITIDRIDQGRVAVLHNVTKDSNGHARIVLNSSAFGPGNYRFTFEGLTWRGEAVPEAWVTIGVAEGSR